MGPAFVCREICDSCDPCYQHDKTKFYYKNENSVKDCGWLDKQSEKGDICDQVETDGIYPSAREACPSSCGPCSSTDSSPTSPTSLPTALPTVPPTALPTAPPTALPTVPPTALPTVSPSSSPTKATITCDNNGNPFVGKAGSRLFI